MDEIIHWIQETITYKNILNKQYNELGDDGRVLWGSGYIQAMKDVLDFINNQDETHDDNLPPD